MENGDLRILRSDRIAPLFRDFFHKEVGDIVLETLGDKVFLSANIDSIALNIGSRNGFFLNHLKNYNLIISQDFSRNFLNSQNTNATKIQNFESNFCFVPHSLDIICDILNPYPLYDLKKFLFFARHSLKPGGKFVSAILGNKTFEILRKVMTELDIKQYGKYIPRLAQLLDMHAISDMALSVGFSKVRSMSQIINVTYKSIKDFFPDLKLGGGTFQNKYTTNFGFSHIFKEIDKFYPKDAEGLYEIEIELIVLCGEA